MKINRYGYSLSDLYTGSFMTALPPLESRVPLLERDEVPAEIAALYDNLYADRGVVPNMFKVLANAPALALGISAVLKPLMADGAIPGWYKELIAARVASLNHCEYCESAHRHLAQRRGASFGQVATYDSFETGPFTEREKSGLRYATRLHQSGHAINEAAYEDVSAHFTGEQLVELTAVAAAFEFFSRFNSALRVPVTPLPGEDLRLNAKGWDEAS